MLDPRPDLAGNTILSALGEQGFADLKKEIRPVSLRPGETMGAADEAIARLVFPCTGMISILVELEGGERIEVGRIGRHGVLGGAVLFGDHCHTASSCVR